MVLGQEKKSDRGAERGLYRLLRVEEVAYVLGISRRWVLHLCEEGRIPHIRVGERFRFDPNELREWVEREGRKYRKEILGKLAVRVDYIGSVEDVAFVLNVGIGWVVRRFGRRRKFTEEWVRGWIEKRKSPPV